VRFGWLPFVNDWGGDFGTPSNRLPKHLSYILRIEIIKPALRPGYYLHIDASTVLSKSAYPSDQQ
jgi:hypothetical protein